MLRELHIRNFALIEQQSINFGRGLNVISGETGAGKSIVLQALQFLLGGKSRAGSIRAGCDEAEVQGLFDLTAVSDMGLELPEIARGEELVVLRSVSTSGRSRVLINGKLGTAAMLQEILGGGGQRLQSESTDTAARPPVPH